MWWKKFIETITASTTRYWSTFHSSVSVNLKSGAQRADNFFEFSKSRSAYFTAMIQVMLAGYIGHVIANSRLQRELDKKENTIESLNEQIRSLEDSNDLHRNDATLLKDSHQDEIKNMANSHQDEIKNTISNHQSEIKEIKRSHREELQEIKRSHREELQNQVDDLKDVIGTLKEDNHTLKKQIFYEKHKKNTYKDALNGSYCFYKQAPQTNVSNNKAKNEEEKIVHQFTNRQ